MADKKNINIDIKNAIHQQASQQQNSGGLKNAMEPKIQNQQNNGLKDVITQFADVKKLLSVANENSKNTFSKLEKNINSLIEIQKQNSTKLSAISTSANQKPPQVKQPDKIEYDQQKFIDQLKIFFDDLNTKLLSIQENINANNSVAVEDKSIDLSSIENSISSSTESIINKLDQTLQNNNNNQQILQILKNISDNLSNNTSENKIDDEITTILNNILQSLNSKQDNSDITNKLDILIQSIDKFNSQTNQSTESENNQNQISKADLDEYLSNIISTLQKKNQNLSYTTILDITNLENSFNIFLQNLKNENSALAQKIIEQKLNITSSPKLSQYSAHDIQVLTAVQKRLQVIQKSIEDFKNNYNETNNNQSNQTELSISLALSKLETVNIPNNTENTISATDIQNLSQSINNLIAHTNSDKQNNTGANQSFINIQLQQQLNDTSEQSDKESDTPNKIIKKNITKNIYNTNQNKPSNQAQTPSNGIAQFGQSLINQFSNLLSNINLFNLNKEPQKKIYKKETKIIKDSKQPQKKQQIDDESKNTDNADNKDPESINQNDQNKSNKPDNADEDNTNKPILNNNNDNISADNANDEDDEDEDDDSDSNDLDELYATLQSQPSTLQQQPQIEASVMNNASTFDDNSDLFMSSPQTEQQNQQSVQNNNNNIIESITLAETQTDENQHTAILTNINDTLMSIQAMEKEILQLQMQQNMPIIAVNSNTISQIAQAIANVKNKEENQKMNKDTSNQKVPVKNVQTNQSKDLNKSHDQNIQPNINVNISPSASTQKQVKQVQPIIKKSITVVQKPIKQIITDKNKEENKETPQPVPISINLVQNPNQSSNNQQQSDKANANSPVIHQKIVNQKIIQNKNQKNITSNKTNVVKPEITNNTGTPAANQNINKPINASTSQPVKKPTVQPHKQATIPVKPNIQAVKPTVIQTQKVVTVQPQKMPILQPAKPASPQLPKASTTQPAKPASPQPPKASTTQPAKPASPQPPKASTTQPAKPVSPQPPKASTTQPAKPASPQPPKASTTQPAKPASPQPPKASTTQPAKPASPQQSKASTIQPTKAATVQPVKSNGKIPSANKSDSTQQKQSNNPTMDITSLLMQSIFGANIMQTEKSKQSSQQSNTPSLNSVFGGLFNRSSLSKEKQQALSEIKTKKMQLKNLSKNAAAVNLELEDIESDILIQTQSMDKLLQDMDDDSEYRQLLDNKEFLQLCKSDQLKDILSAIQMCDKQLQRLSGLKDSAKDKDSIILQQKNVNEVKKQLLIQKSNIQKKDKQQAKSKQLEQRMKETQVSINKIQKDSKLTDEQIKIGLNESDNSPMNLIAAVMFEAFAQLLGISTGNAKSIQLTPEKIQDQLQKPQKTEQQLVSQAFKKYTSIDSGNPIVDNYLNSYVNKRFADIKEKNPDLTSKEINTIGSSLIKQFETAWNNDMVLIPSKDGSTYSQYPKSKIQQLQKTKQPLVLQDINIKDNIDTAVQNQKQSQIQQTNIKTTQSNAPMSDKIDSEDEEQGEEEKLYATLQDDQQSDQIYINQGQFDQDMSKYMLQQLQYQKNKQIQQAELQQWKTTGSDQISQLFADTKNNYVSSEITALTEANDLSPKQQQEYIQVFKDGWDNNFKNDIIIYTENGNTFKSNKDDFLEQYYITNKSIQLEPPVEPEQKDYIIVNPTEQQKTNLILQPYTQKDQNGNVLDKNGEVVQAPPKPEQLPKKDKMPKLQSQKPQKTPQKKQQKKDADVKPNAVTTALMSGGNVAQAYRNSKKQQKQSPQKMLESMLGNYSKMFSVNTSDLSSIFGINKSQQKQNDDNKKEQAGVNNTSTSTSTQTNNVSNVKNVDNSSSSVVSNVQNTASNALSSAIATTTNTISNLKSTATNVVNETLPVVKSSTNPLTEGTSKIQKLAQTEKQKAKKDITEKASSAQTMQSLFTTMTSTIINNSNASQPKQQNSDKLLQGIASLIEASKPQVIYIWPSQPNDPPKINTIVNI